MSEREVLYSGISTQFQGIMGKESGKSALKILEDAAYLISGDKVDVGLRLRPLAEALPPL